MPVSTSSGWEESILRDQSPERNTGPMSARPSGQPSSSQLGSSLPPDPRGPSLPAPCTCLVGKLRKASEPGEGHPQWAGLWGKAGEG